ncbi:MAG: hypothetical protein IPH99_08890 [Xanthomonadales bacterium]|nr:hypothetical protein [Xanthomonadales bacterium]
MTTSWVRATLPARGKVESATARKTGAPALAWKWLRHRWLDWTGQAGIVARAGNCAMAAPAQLPGPARI